MQQVLNLVTFACLLLLAPTAAAESVRVVNECRRSLDAHVFDGCSLLQVKNDIAIGVRRSMSTDVSTDSEGSVGMVRQQEDHDMTASKSIESAVAEFAKVVHATRDKDRKSSQGASLSDNDDDGTEDIPGYQNCPRCIKAFWSKKSCMTVPYCIGNYHLKDPDQVRGANNVYLCSDEGNNVYARHTTDSEWSKRPGCALWMSSFMIPFRQKLLELKIDLYADFDDSDLIAENTRGAEHKRDSDEAKKSVQVQLDILKDKVALADVFAYFEENDGWFCKAEKESADKTGSCSVVQLKFQTYLDEMDKFLVQEGIRGQVPRPDTIEERQHDANADEHGIAFGGQRPRTGYPLHDHATEDGGVATPKNEAEAVESDRSGAGPLTNQESMPKRTQKGELNGDRKISSNADVMYSNGKGNVANQAGVVMAAWFAEAIEKHMYHVVQSRKSTK